MEFYKSERGGDVCLYQAFEYIVKMRREEGVIHWRCREYRKFRCKATLITKGDEVMKQQNEHCHGANLARARANLVVSQMKEDAAAQSTTTRNILGSRLEGVPATVLANMPKKGSIERRIRKARQTAQVPLPEPVSKQKNKN